MAELEQNPAIFTRAGVIFYSTVFVIALIGAKLADRIEGWHHPEGPELLLQLGAGVGAGALAIWISRVAERLIPGVRALSADFSEMLRGLSRLQAWILAFFSGVAEEALFRGTLQPIIGLIPATLLFGVIHIGPARRYLWWTLSAVIYGFGLGLLFEWGRSLVSPVIAHMVINGVNLYRLGNRPPLPRRRQGLAP